MTVRKSKGVLTTRKPFRPSEAGKLNSGRTAHVAARPVRADEPTAGPPLRFAVARDCNLHACAILGYVLDLGAELQLELRRSAQLLMQDARQLRLLALHPIGVMRKVGNGAEIELPQHTVPLGAILEPRRDQALRDERSRGAEPLEHIERRRMKGRGPRFPAQIGSRLEHRHRHAAAHQIGSRHQPHRPRACNQHPFVHCHKVGAEQG
jgi:hypothetical protein